jgi:hypothetical protein
MNEPRETANADVYQAIARSVKDIAPFDDAQGRLWQGGMEHSFPEKVARRATFSGKDKKVPCCRRRICRSLGETSGLNADRVRRVNYGRIIHFRQHRTCDDPSEQTVSI